MRNEFFDASNDLHGKRVIPMRFALIDRGGFAELADAVGFMPMALYGDYDRGEYLEGQPVHDLSSGEGQAPLS